MHTSKRINSLKCIKGKLPEWSNGADSKSAILLRVSGVRIPHFPQAVRKEFKKLASFFIENTKAIGNSI